MKTDFSKILPAFILFLTLCYLQTHEIRANTSLGDVSTKVISGSVAVPAVSINNVTMNEGNSGTTAFSFTVTLSETSGVTVAVSFETANATATAPSDFQSVSGTLSFAPGETSKSVVVLVNGDTTIEENEAFTVVLTNPINATIGSGTGIGTIVNDEGTTAGCTYSISPTSLNVNANGSSGNTISVTTQPGCAFTATASDSFITINSGASGFGNGTIVFSVAFNNTGVARTGTITVAGQTFVVNQLAAGSPGLRVGITDSPDPVTVNTGQNITYTIFVINDSATTATGVVLTNTLPAGFEFISVNTQIGSCSQSGRVITCNLGNVIDIATVTIVARPTAPGTFTNTVSVSGNEADPDAGDNTASAVTTVNSQPATTGSDLRVLVIDTPSGPITLGSGNIVYSISVDNDGPTTTATGVVVTSTLSSNLQFVSASTQSGGCSFAAGVVTCNIGNLVRGTSIVITARPTAPGTASNTVSVRGSEVDPVASNNSVTVTKTVNPATGTANADLRVTVLEPLTANTFESTNFEVFVNNDGPSPATGVILTNTLPSNVSFVSATTNQGTCTHASGVVTCNLGTVTGSVSITITVVPTASGTATNTASVRANEIDFNTSNNSVTTTTTVNFSKTRKRTRISQ